jgi:hypothetical protein
MSRPEALCLSLVILGGSCLPAARGYGGELPAQAPVSQTPLQISIANEAPGRQPVFRAYLTSGTNKFAFLVPGGFVMDANTTAGNAISLINGDYNCWLTVRLLGQSPDVAAAPDPETCRQWLLSRHPGAKILEEFSLTAADRSGPAFNAQWETSGGSLQSARVAFIPSAAGILEFSLLAGADKLPRHIASLNTVLVSFRASVNGKLEVPPLSDKS